ncbi:MAG TPA: protein kinase [Vicinamibacteria bacterium]|nr:protein kinase [Vicinamibacteria bacterium]
MGLAAGHRLGAYQIVAPLGAGGMGEVYRARDARLDRDVAIKVLPAQLSEDPAALARFEREAKAVASISHPNILAIFEFGSTDAVAYAVTELLEGETLRAQIVAGPLPARKAVDYAAQIAEGLGAAHDHGIVHRDLKPENLFVTREDRVKILDFGLARQQAMALASDDTRSPTLSPGTEPGTVLGTVGYMSPEQVRGLPADARSDIFSFGAVLYEMLSGRRAFQRDSSAETMHAILKEEPPGRETTRALPPALERIVGHCLEKRPEQRFHSAHDLAFHLRALSTATGASHAISAPASLAGRRRALLAALVAAAIGLGVLADRTLGRRSPEQPPTYRRLTFDRGSIGSARFAADGETIVYDAAWRSEPSDVFTSRIDSRESRSLGLRSAVLYGVSSRSELAIGLDPWGRFGDGTLGRVPLAGGAPREVLENVAGADRSPDGEDLAVVHHVAGVARLEFPIGKVLYQSKGTITHLRVSPPGDRVAFVDHADPLLPDSAGSVVAVTRAGDAKTLSSGWADLFGLAWRPDGREVWFTAAKRGEFKALRAVTLEGRERLVTRVMGQLDLQDVSRSGRVLVDHPSFRMEMIARVSGAAKDRELTWLGMSQMADLSKDGSRVLFTELPEGASEGGSSYLRATDGSPAVRLGEGVAQALSPDGRWALSIRTSPSRLIVLPTGPGQLKDLTRPGFAYLSGGWFPDSRGVLFNAAAQGRPRAYTQDLEGGEPRALGPEGAIAVAVSPDGRLLVSIPKGGTPLLYPLAGGEPRPIPGIEPGEQAIGWSQDGRSLYVARPGSSAVKVHRLDLATGRRQLLHDLAPADPAGVYPGFTPGISADGKSCAYSFIRSLSQLYLIDGLK